ncbi:MAG: thioredoxin domain-containing protein, partial [Actinobacteria bacterium]|nr:thioredoxin domain-containing protein [Actinomycetota bacterium]
MTNRLAQETSPYLRQHKDNPVDWFSWSTEAFTEAQRRGVPILLSVGYSACHWCHVMAHECFEDLETATMMNELFVNIKVDREERPDIDALYMDAVQAMSGRGGWPMTVFMSPDGNPFFGGTYFPKPSFMKLMVAVHDAWQNRRADIENNISALSESLSRSALITPDVSLPSFELVAAACDQLAESFDPKWGGFGGAPKFPSTMNLDLLLRIYNDSPNDSLGTIITTTLDAMASGGIYDHIGGGFSRYSVDEKWLVPHFEKMLYDQALLLRVYSHAAVVFESENYRQICEEIVDYVVRDLRDLEGGFFSAEDADSLDQHGHSHEGHFYVFSPDELREILSKDQFDIALEYYEISESGNFEGKNIPTRLSSRGDLKRPPEVEVIRQKIFAERNKRHRP